MSGRLIQLLDLGAEFWRNYYGTSKSAIDAYNLTAEKIRWHWDDNKLLIVCCDSPSSLRRDIVPSYKANRKPKEPDAIDSLVSVEECAKRWGVPVAKVDGYEADDLIGTFVAQSYPHEVRVLGDEKDLYCLIEDGRVHLWGKRGKVDAAACLEKWDVEPWQMTEFLALCGDASDNIVGCENLGPMRAAGMLKRFGTIAAAQAATDGELLELPKVGPKTVASFRAWDSAQALSLVRLMTAPIHIADLLPEIDE